MDIHGPETLQVLKCAPYNAFKLWQVTEDPEREGGICEVSCWCLSFCVCPQEAVSAYKSVSCV